MQVLINGETLELPEQFVLSDLITQLSLTPERVAIELNQRVVRRPDWAKTFLSDGDRIEIVHFVGGGSVESCRQQKGIGAGGFCFALIAV